MTQETMGTVLLQSLQTSLALLQEQKKFLRAKEVTVTVG